MSVKRKSKEQVAKRTIEGDVFMEAVRFSDHMLAEINILLSIWGMTAVQYYALRVLYVHDTDGFGLPSGEVGKLLPTRVPDVTRLLDRLADKGWLIRARDQNNRRVVRAQLTNIGFELVESVDAPLKELEKKLLERLNDANKKTLKELLEQVSSPSSNALD